MKWIRLIIEFIIIIFLCILSTCIYYLLKDYKELSESNKDTNSIIEKSIITDEITNRDVINWDYLKLVNEHIIAWIKIEGTNINYPILKDNTLYYLKHTFEKKYNNNGSIFTTNAFPFKDNETIIYGHNMKNGYMFSDLSNYLNKEFLYNHNKFKIYTPECNYQATIISVYSIGSDTENDNIKLLDFNEKIAYYKKSSKYYINNNEDIDKIVKLCTCSYINVTTIPTDQRYFIIANLTAI